VEGVNGGIGGLPKELVEGIVTRCKSVVWIFSPLENIWKFFIGQGYSLMGVDWPHKGQLLIPHKGKRLIIPKIKHLLEILHNLIICTIPASDVISITASCTLPCEAADPSLIHTGFAFLIFKDETSVHGILESCMCEGDKFFLYVTFSIGRCKVRCGPFGYVC
jgi:hypothetical protein